jgi:hypothetical protein
VVPVRPDLEEPDLIASRDLQAHVPERLVHLVRADRPPVLRRTDEVIQQGGDIVAAVDVLTHAPNVSQPDAASRGELDP